MIIFIKTNKIDENLINLNQNLIDINKKLINHSKNVINFNIVPINFDENVINLKNFKKITFENISLFLLHWSKTHFQT